MKFSVDQNFPNRYDRAIKISIGDISIETGVFDSRSEYAKALSIQLCFSAGMIINHHEIPEETCGLSRKHKPSEDENP